MKDRFFYPLAILIIGGMIAYALSFKADNTPSNVDIYERKGAELEALFPSPGTAAVISGGGEEVFAVLSAHMKREIAPPSAGVFGTLGPAYEQNFGEANIRITVRARSGENAPSAAMELGYFTTGVGDSGWKRFDLTESFADYSFDFTPNAPSGKGNDYVGIWPDPSGEGGEIYVTSIKVERITP